MFAAQLSTEAYQWPSEADMWLGCADHAVAMEAAWTRHWADPFQSFDRFPGYSPADCAAIWSQKTQEPHMFHGDGLWQANSFETCAVEDHSVQFEEEAFTESEEESEDSAFAWNSPTTSGKGSDPATIETGACSPCSRGSRSTGSETSWTPLSMLPLPLRVPVGPDPSFIGSDNTDQGASDLSDTQGTGMLLPLGATLTKAASLGVCADGSQVHDRTPQRLETSPSLSTEATARFEAVAKIVPTSFSTATTAPQAPVQVRAQSATAVPDVGASRTVSEIPTSACSAGVAQMDAPPGMFINLGEVNGEVCTKVEWRIEDLRGRLQASMGRPLVSPSFLAAGLPNLRLMVFPDAREAVKSARSRERKGMYAAMVKKGPLYGSLKLKADCLERATVLKFYLSCGSARRGPFVYNFAEQAIHGCDDFGVDWLKQVEDMSGCLSVSVEILKPEECEDCAAKMLGGATASKPSVGNAAVIPIAALSSAADVGPMAGTMYSLAACGDMGASPKDRHHTGEMSAAAAASVPKMAPAATRGAVKNKRSLASQQRLRGRLQTTRS
eukprot:TRINITY_DN14113_c0_g1_i1.p1 TRINITY_DN14113_c0_g1~~TRINITY_DN14113_c0_g1_i1.p1  ORF type:complete len:555 (+),score=86.89 TRINITY_DN14113_c0_g1_i1:79-1743(+)